MRASLVIRTSARLSLAWLLAAGLAMPAACSAGPSAPAERAPSGRPGRRIVLVGLDAADWLTIDPLARAGKLPTFARLRTEGRTGVLLVTPPLISPIIWTTIATGVHPEDHGILDFMVDLADGTQAPVTSGHRTAAALWNLFSDAGRKVAVIGWWATWPAESVRGTVVSDALSPQLLRSDARVKPDVVSPAGAADLVSRALVKAEALTYGDLAAYGPLTRAEFEQLGSLRSAPASRFYENKVAHLAAVVASTRTYSSLAVSLARAERPHLLAVYLESVDTIQHLFVRDPSWGPRAIERAYRDADDLVRQLAEASAPDTLVVVCSDHGFYPPTAGITEDPSNLAGPATAWHRPYGIVAMAEAGLLSGRSTTPQGTRGQGHVGTVTPIDIAPTVLHAASLPVPGDMPGAVIAAMLPQDVASRTVRRGPASTFTPQPSAAPGDDARRDVLARLQALGYVGSVKTSLARQNLGESLFRRGKLPAAERELRAVLEVQPDNLGAQLWLAKALAGQGRKDEALRAYERAVALPGGAREAIVEATDLAVASGQLERAAALVREAGAEKAAGAAVATARGMIAEARQQPGEAERQYRSALRTDPLSFEAAARLFDLLGPAGRATDVVAPLRRATALAPDSARHEALLGSALLAARDVAGAEAAFARALALAPDGDPVRIGLARAQLLRQRADAAVSTLLEARPSSERSILLGAAYSSLGRWTDAVRELQSVVTAGSVTPDVLNSLGWAQLKLGRTQEAAAVFSRSLALKPGQPEIRKLLAEAQSAPAGSTR